MMENTPIWEQRWEERKDYITNLSNREAYELAKEYIIYNCLDDDELWKALIQGIKDSWHNKSNMLDLLVDMISHNKGEEWNRYIRELIYNNNLEHYDYKK